MNVILTLLLASVKQPRVSIEIFQAKAIVQTGHYNLQVASASEVRIALNGTRKAMFVKQLLDKQSPDAAFHAIF